MWTDCATALHHVANASMNRISLLVDLGGRRPVDRFDQPPSAHRRGLGVAQLDADLLEFRVVTRICQSQAITFEDLSWRLCDSVDSKPEASRRPYSPIACWANRA
jgi:hypothetical protein